MGPNIIHFWPNAKSKQRPKDTHKGQNRNSHVPWRAQQLLKWKVLKTFTFNPSWFVRLFSPFLFGFFFLVWFGLVWFGLERRAKPACKLAFEEPKARDAGQQVARACLRLAVGNYIVVTFRRGICFMECYTLTPICRALSPVERKECC